MGKHSMSLRERILSNCEQNSSGCWTWKLHVSRDGYGRLSINGSPKSAHRLAYEAFRGPIPQGMTVDHICFTRSCVNPDHLRLLTAKQNRKRQRAAFKTRCINGHEYTPENTYIRPTQDGQRDCRACIRERVRRYKGRKAA